MARKKRKEEIVEEVVEIKEEAAEEKIEPKKEKQLVYIGPMLKSGILSQNSIFMGIPKHIEEDIKKCPAIKKLFVTPEKLAEAKKNLKKQGTLENIYYKAIEKYNRGGN